MAKLESADIDGAALQALADSGANRNRLAAAATLKVKGKAGAKEDRSWFKDMKRGECLGDIVFGCLEDIPENPLSQTINGIKMGVPLIPW